MNYTELTNEQIQHIKSIKLENEVQQMYARKNYINDLIVGHFSIKKNLWLYIITQYGKSLIIKQLAHRYRKKFSGKIIIVVPETRIKAQFDKLLSEYENVDVYVVNTYCNLNNNIDRECDVLVIDEVQHFLDENSVRNSSVFNITNYKFCVVNAAILGKDQIKRLEGVGIKDAFKLDLNSAIKLELAPCPKTYCVSVELTNKEKLEYIKMQENYKHYENMLFPLVEKQSIQAWMYLVPSSKKGVFKVGNKQFTHKEFTKYVANYLEWNENSVIGTAIKWMSLVTKRKTLLKEAENKLTLAVKLRNKHKEEKGLYFVNTQKQAVKLQKLLGKSSIIYTSKTKASNLDEFREGKFKELITVGKAYEGNVDNEISYSVHLDFTSKPLKFVQSRGRAMALDENNLEKSPKSYFLYIDDFKFNNVECVSQEKVWLENAIKGQQFIEFIKNEEIN